MRAPPAPPAARDDSDRPGRLVPLSAPPQVADDAAVGWRCVVVAAVLVIPPLHAHEEGMSVGVSPVSCTDPCTVFVGVRLEPHGDDRVLTVEADSERFYTSSTIELTGAGERRLHRIRFNNIPAGTYVVRAIRDRRGEGRFRVTAALQVFGR
jgi:hypothetical protein